MNVLPKISPRHRAGKALRSTLSAAFVCAAFVCAAVACAADAAGSPIVPQDGQRSVAPGRGGGTPDSLAARIRALTEEAMRLHTLQSERGLRAGKDALRLAGGLKDTILMARAHNAIGANHWIRGAYDLAVREYMAGLELAEAAGSLADVGAGHSNLGLLCRTIGLSQRAEDYLRAAIRIRTSINDAAGLARSRMNLGLLFFETGRLDSARMMHELSLETGRASGDTLTIARNLHYLGRIERHGGRLVIARRLMKESLEVFEAIGDRNGRSLVAADLAGVLLSLGRAKDALAYGEQALREAKRLDSQFAVREAARVLSRIHERAGRYRDALESSNLASQADEHLKHRDASVQLAQAGIEQQIAEREEVWRLRERERQLRWEAARNNERIVRNSLLIGVTLLAVLFLVFLFAYRAKRRGAGLIAEQNRRIDETNRELRLEVETRQRMLSIIAHDLLGPLGAAEGMLQLAREGTVTKEEEEELAGGALVTLRGSVNLLHALVNWARMQERDLKLVTEEGDVMEVLRSAFDLLHPVARARDLQLTMTGPERFRFSFDRHIVTVLAENLLSNAVKFTSEGGTVRLEVERGEGECLIRVHDSGRGMPREIVDRIREGKPLLSTEGSRGEMGHGLGLEICQRLTALHRGVLWVESEEGIGSTFTLRLPLHPVGHSRNAREVTSEPADSSR